MSSLHHPAGDLNRTGKDTSKADSDRVLPRPGWSSVRRRYLPITYSLILIGLGVAACVFPFAGTLLAAYYLGWTLIAGGVSCVIAGISHWRERGHWLDLLLGLVTTVFGVSFLLLPVAGAALILWSLSLWFGVSGAMKIMAAIHFREGRAMLIFTGLADFILSACLVIAFATLDVALVSLFVGFSFIMSGVAAFVRGAGYPSPEASLI